MIRSLSLHLKSIGGGVAAAKIPHPPGPARRRVIRALMAFDIGMIGLMGGIFFWLAVKAPDTEHAIIAKIPAVTVKVERPAPPPAPEPEAVAAPQPVLQPEATPSASADVPAMASAASPEPPPAPLPAPADVSAVPTAAMQPLVPPPPLATNGGLVAAPLLDLTESSPYGLLPRIGKDGTMPWRFYARSFDVKDKRPRIAIIIDNIGLLDDPSNAAVQTLPPEITLAMSAYTDEPGRWVKDARAAGHELLLMVPMEPRGYPVNDPGPKTLLTALTDADNIQRLNQNLAQMVGYVGVTTLTGSRFTTSSERLKPVLAALKARGLMFVDSRVSPHSLGALVARDIALPHAINDIFLDNILIRSEIDKRLQDLEEIAMSRGVAVGIGSPLPITYERLKVWIPTLKAKGIILVPITAAAGMQNDH